MLTFDEQSHKYSLKGKVIPSVTQIIREVLKGDKELEQTDAMNFGSVIHKVLELNDIGVLNEYEYDEMLNPFIEQWNKFKQEYNIERLECEVKKYCPVNNFCGTIDRICTMDGEAIIIDIKTGNSYKEYPLQTAGYALLLDNKVDTFKRACVYIKEDSCEIDFHKKTTDFEVFKSLLTVWKFKKNKL